ncbi:H-NS family nucleoid-associated regulatory protein [Bradyrhizobium sp. B117]|uniref:H-NS histone family protein n=1 Tax=Bradyrhizobium sp. B117 TaxID=3140246 RepID=UPI0031846002
MTLEQQIFRLSADELWNLYQQIQLALLAKMRAQMLEMDQRLEAISKARRPLDLPLRPPIKSANGKRHTLAPKFRNPDDPNQTWAGRGLQPNWLKQAMKHGKRLEDFTIREGSTTGKRAKATMRSQAN